MEFKKDLPEWKAEGVEPPKSLKEEGWKAQNKPPADYFNWFFYKTYQSLLDVVENAQHKSEKGQPDGYAALDSEGKVPPNQLALTKSQVGLGNVDNVKQATKTDFDKHVNDKEKHVTVAEREKWNKTPTKEEINLELNKKVDKVEGKGLSSNDYTTEEKDKLTGIEPDANKYVHPETHPASIITESPDKQFVTAAEKTEWGKKETPTGAQEKVDALAGDGNMKTVKQLDDDVTTHLAEKASLTTEGHVQLSDATNSTSKVLAATPSAVKEAMDRADAAFTSASNGKQTVGNAITGVDDSVVIPTNPTYEQLADAIGRISIGREWAEGSVSLEWNEQTLSVNGLSFKPTIILAQAIGTHSGRELTVYAELTTLITNSKVPTAGNAGISDTKLYDDGFSLEISKGSSKKEVEWIAFE